MIILTQAQADAVNGETTPGHALEPVPLTDGTFALPEAVLTDPGHAPKWPFLSTLARRDVDDSEFVSA